MKDDIEEVVVEPEDFGNGVMFSRDYEDDEDEDGLYVVRSRVQWSNKERQNTEEVVQYVYLEPKK